jgi:hypothetical protein
MVPANVRLFRITGDVTIEKIQFDGIDNWHQSSNTSTTVRVANKNITDNDFSNDQQIQMWSEGCQNYLSPVYIYII